ncbi:hypothetical protein UO65_2011 [Actinokineospora spheciospongiae]|uniref:Uncharacterized protein n=1 Tax=Actinokineospora spheciospongiae TaxID=909613 RepID=W7J9H8_9PSEU|nr:hypothetical protein UO65_2011 [Actinokineospora spheciospongiae]
MVGRRPARRGTRPRRRGPTWDGRPVGPPSPPSYRERRDGGRIAGGVVFFPPAPRRAAATPPRPTPGPGSPLATTPSRHPHAVP